MNASRKTRQQLIDEIARLQERLSGLEDMEAAIKKAQSDLLERFGHFFPKANHMKEAIFVLFDRKLEFINELFTEIFGFTQEEACSPGFDPMAMIAPESRGVIRKKYRQGCLGDFSADQFEFTGMSKDGTRIECETFVLFIPYKWGVAVHGVLRNISAHKRIAEELQRRRSDLQVVLDSIPTSVFYTDQNHRFTRANSAFCKNIGIPLDQILGKSFPELFPNLPAEQLTHLFEVSDQVLSSGCAKRGLVEIMPSLRGRRWMQNDRIPYRDDEGNMAGVICLAVDISDLRETEEKLWYMSFYDVLTGLYNRAYFDEQLNRLEKGRQCPISVIVAKVSDLVAINEREGIAAGNELLKQTAKALKVFRAEDVVARISGDRFAAVMPLAGRSVGEDVLLRIRGNIEAHNREHEGKPLNLSLGLATEEKKCSLRNVLAQAEAAAT